MIKRWFITSVICLIFNYGFTQSTIPKKLIGVWKLNSLNSDLCMVFINQNTGAFTYNSGMLIYYFNYKLTVSGEEPILVSESIPIYSEKEDFYKCLIQLINDSTLLLNTKISKKDAKLMQGKTVFIYNKITGVNAETFIKKPKVKDFIGDWTAVDKRDTLTIFKFKSNNTIEFKIFPSKKIISATYDIDSNSQPMSINITYKTGVMEPYIFTFIDNHILRFAKPKNGQKRSMFTTFGGNIRFLKKR